MSLRQKRRYAKLPLKDARLRFREIWARMHPDKDLAETHGKEIWKLLEIYCRIRLAGHADTIDAMAVSFAESLGKRNKQNHALAQIIHSQRKRLAGIQRQLDAIQAGTRRELPAAPLVEREG